MRDTPTDHVAHTEVHPVARQRATPERPRRNDLLHDEVPDEFIARVFAVMAATPQHTYQILTKRHARMRSLLSRGELGTDGFPDKVEEAMAEFTRASLDHWPLPNVWLGVSVENQQWADIRIPALLQTPAAVRWLSCEPLLGPVDLTRIAHREGGGTHLDVVHGRHGVPGAWEGPGKRVDWVVVGGESGPRARPMHPDWVRSLRDQCHEARDVAFFMKQWGEWAPAPWVVRVCDPAHGWDGTPEELEAAKAEAERVGATHALMPSGYLYEPPHRPWSIERCGHQPGAVRRYGRKHAGRVLDGRTWDQYPQVRTA